MIEDKNELVNQYKKEIEIFKNESFLKQKEQKKNFKKKLQEIKIEDEKKLREIKIENEKKLEEKNN